MAHAEKCPICSGTGRVNTDDKSIVGGQIPCYGCGGKGWVEVQERTLNPMYPYYPPTYPTWFPIIIT